MRVRHVAMLIMLLPSTIGAQADEGARNLQRSVEQLRDSIGHWNVMTEFLRPDGSPGKTLSGTYDFSLVIPDRLITGQSDVPELERRVAILFYVPEAKKQIAMVSDVRMGGGGS